MQPCVEGEGHTCVSWVPKAVARMSGVGWDGSEVLEKSKAPWAFLLSRLPVTSLSGKFVKAASLSVKCNHVPIGLRII